MPLQLVIASLVICSAVAPWVLAESTDCTTPVVIIPDGRPTQSSFPQSTSYWYGVYAQAGHSYSVEFEPPPTTFSIPTGRNSVRSAFLAPPTIYKPVEEAPA
jgi:hypothetical protein